MWRVQGFVGRVLQRCYGNTQLRLPQNHHVEDEVINSSAVLSTSRHGSDSSSQRGEDGERRRKQKTFDFGQAELPRYTAMDAVGLGAAAVLFMQLCRRIHSQFTSGTEPSLSPGALTQSTLHKCGYRILLEILSKDNVLPGRTVLCLQGAPEGPKRDELQALSNSGSVHGSSSSSSSTDDASLHRSSEPNPLTSDPERQLLIQDSSMPDELYLSSSRPPQNDGNQVNTQTNPLSNEEKLAESAFNLKQVEDTSVPVILNIIGLESAKSGNYEEAFICFKAAAEQGYRKAQFNVGVCYEKGRGVHKDREKALHHYWQAAVGGHRQAQYRHAKLLLSSRGQPSVKELNAAIGFLEQAAKAGLTEAMVCLASVYSQEPVRDESKSIHYLKMAAHSGDDRALLFLGQCYEGGLGVQRNVRTATEYYKRAAQAGNKQAKQLLMPPNPQNSKDSVLRSISSAPCFAGTHLQQPLSSRLTPSAFTLPLLPHSWSTGSLCMPSLSSSLFPINPLNTEGGNCQWTVGLG